MEETTGLVRREAALGDDVVEELAARDIFVDEENVSGGVNYFVEADYVRVSAETEDVDFSL